MKQYSKLPRQEQELIDLDTHLAQIGMRHVISGQLLSSLGHLRDLDSRLLELNTKQLLALAEALLKFKSTDDFEKWFETKPVTERHLEKQNKAQGNMLDDDFDWLAYWGINKLEVDKFLEEIPNGSFKQRYLHGYKQGFEQGTKERIEEQHLALVKALTSVLLTRLGDLRGLDVHLQALTWDQLYALCDTILEFKSTADLEKWLKGTRI